MGDLVPGCRELGQRGILPPVLSAWLALESPSWPSLPPLAGAEKVAAILERSPLASFYVYVTTNLWQEGGWLCLPSCLLTLRKLQACIPPCGLQHSRRIRPGPPSGCHACPARPAVFRNAERGPCGGRGLFDELPEGDPKRGGETLLPLEHIQAGCRVLWAAEVPFSLPHCCPFVNGIPLVLLAPLYIATFFPVTFEDFATSNNGP
ncbi:UNVERIFIED_CONTAM: hypothetical protein K2H54_052501 [Gekko kuhli]